MHRRPHRIPRPPRHLFGALGGLVLAATLTSATLGHLAEASRIYRVADVVSGLRQHPGAWIGRTVLVHGRVSDVELTSAKSMPPFASVDDVTPPSGVSVDLLLVPITTTASAGQNADLRASERIPLRVKHQPPPVFRLHVSSWPRRTIQDMLRRTWAIGPGQQPKARLDVDKTAVFRLTLLPDGRCKPHHNCVEARLDGVQ